MVKKFETINVETKENYLILQHNKINCGIDYKYTIIPFKSIAYIDFEDEHLEILEISNLNNFDFNSVTSFKKITLNMINGNKIFITCKYIHFQNDDFYTHQNDLGKWDNYSDEIKELNDILISKII